MEEMQQLNLSWIEVQFLKKAVDILCQCRQTLMYTYVFAFYLKKNNQSIIFEVVPKQYYTLFSISLFFFTAGEISRGGIVMLMSVGELVMVTRSLVTKLHIGDNRAVKNPIPYNSGPLSTVYCY